MSGGNGNSSPAVILSDSDQCQLLQGKVRDFGIRDLSLTLAEDIMSTNTCIKKFMVQRYFTVARTYIASSGN